jgi:hypothetical protein
MLFIIGALLWFLPVLGIELLPIGLLLIAEDVPFLRKPVAKCLVWLERKWVALRDWWKRKRTRRREDGRHPAALRRSKAGRLSTREDLG